jgi:hypothetical protein
VTGDSAGLSRDGEANPDERRFAPSADGTGPAMSVAVAVLAPAYAPRRPTETVLYGLVRQHLESFLAHAREHYESGLPRYVEQELRAYLKCGVFYAETRIMRRQDSRCVRRRGST